MTAKSGAGSGFGLDRIGQIHVPVRELDEAIAFYRDALGIPFLFQAPPGMAFFRCGDTTLMLGAPESEGQLHPSSILYFTVEDIDGAHGILEERGVEFLAAPHEVHRAEDHELWMAFFRDPSGNTHALMGRKARSAD